MSLTSPNSNLQIQFPNTNHLSFLSTTTHEEIQQFRVWKRFLKNKKKSSLSFSIHNSLSPEVIVSSSFNNLFKNFITQFPYVNSFDVILPALGLASGIFLYLQQSKPKSKRRRALFSNSSSATRQRRLSGGGGGEEDEEWVLFSSPTPFNRFVILRCSSILLLENDGGNVNEKLVKEERHYVKLNGRVRDFSSEDGGDGVVYQRVCVSCDDGGVISLDWPVNLDLEEGNGLDTTMLLVPGTAEGSGDRDVKLFVAETLRRGCFPIVMNPRGSAGSPLTTPRLFTAGDSDDIRTAIQFINSSRPGNTLMGVGWGYGANMLTKYLAEVSERTPLTAVVCIDNPFDLEEATRSSLHHNALDQKLADGLKEILKSNKALFQGRAKKFDVEKALEATSLRDFDQAISVVSCGYEGIEEFYSKSSTRESVDKVKIPTLFIQTDNGTAPQFSIPRSAIAENPFTSVLLRSRLPSGIMNERSASPWCQGLVIEWLTAVELGFLKGRHPLLEDVDVTINPSKGLSLVEGISSDEPKDSSKIRNLSEYNALSAYGVDPPEESDKVANVPLRSQKQLPDHSETQKVGESDEPKHSSSPDAEAVEEEGEVPVNEESQVLQSAQVVMNMLDVTMPGTLSPEQKRKVLMAMEQGETLKMALDGAVPEDVRGKLAAAVSAMTQAKGMKVNADGIMDASQINLSDFKASIQETVGEPSPPASESNDVQTSESKKESDGSSDDTGDKDQPVKIDQDQEKGESKDQKIEEKNIDSSADQNEAGTSSTSDKHSNSEETVDTGNSGGAQVKTDQDGATADSGKKEDNDDQHTDGKTKDDSIDEKDTTAKTEESSPVAASSPEAPPTDKEADNVPKKEDEKPEPSTDQNQQASSKAEEPPPPNPPAPPPALGAFEAFTGFDDSTQMAVNSVFGVLENIINQYDAQNEEDQQKNGDKQEKQSGEQPGSSTREAAVPQSEDKSASGDTDKGGVKSASGDADKGEVKSASGDTGKGEVSLDSDDDLEKSDDTEEDAGNGSRGKQLTQNSISYMKNSFSSQGSKGGGYAVKGKGEKRGVNLNVSKSSGKTRQLHKVPVYVTVNPYGDSLYNEYLREYLLSNVSGPKSLDLDSTTDLLLEYSSEEGKWKFLDDEDDDSASESDDDTNEYKGSSSKGQDVRSSAEANDADEIIETSYVVLDTENEQRPLEDHNSSDDLVRKLGGRPPRSGDPMLLVKNIILDTLKVEVGRRLGVQEMEPSLASELERVADVVSLGIGQSRGLEENKEPSSGKLGTIQGGYVLKTISFAVTETTYLRKVLPVGVIVGSCLAALRKYFTVAVQQDGSHSLEDGVDKTNITREEIQGHEGGTLSKQKPSVKKEKDEHSDSEDEHSDSEDEHSALDNFISLASENVQNLSSNTVVVGAVTAALGASAFLVPQQIEEQFENGESAEISSTSFSENRNENGDAISDRSQNNLVSSFAEKAMSVAAPVVPTTSDGAVDQDRLVAVLAEWGQRGGMLRLVGKLALLWGGLRGAMSLTNRLISFLHISERPLPQRILGFVCMVLVLWTPVVIPLLPTLVQNWTTQSSGMAEYACIVGLYAAVIILIMLWGKRIRECDHEHPLRRYGLDLTSLPKLQDFAVGLLGGFMLILSIHSTNALLGCASLSWPSSLSSSSTQAIFLLKGYGGMLLLAGQAVVTATVVAIVEELFFRSWLPEEVAVDIGHHRAVLVSGLAFAIFQRSLQAIPGLWLLSLALSGARQRNKGSLAVPIGMRAGILASCYILQKGGFLIYHRSYPIWLTGTDTMQPFSGVVGLAASLIVALLLYKKQSSGTAMVPKAAEE
ncbi:uncharacterized protein LOC113328223 [Papaver somniferum]|uniref:uncharacterized protein LOC113328223 n=1 Tax=Papaver somniferum TaxID=3469 RepID=UPI000E701300|nr:uncharacterized protein LOC113328223 [Papaver somniferum]